MNKPKEENKKPKCLSKQDDCRFLIICTNECDYIHDCEHKKYV